MIRVFLADDHPVVRSGLRQAIDEEPDMRVVAEASDGWEVLRCEAEWDVLVLDLNMPGGNSLEAIPELRKLYPQLAILVLSVHPEQQAGIKAIMAGASGYLNKVSAPEQFVSAVRQVASGSRYISSSLGAALADYLFHRQNEKLPHQTLSEREYTVLLKIAQGYTTAEIAEQLGLSPKTVGTYRARVLEKMGISTSAELTRYVVEKGLAEESR